jgi:hypothetical protein
MDSRQVSEMIRGNLRDCARRGIRVPVLPDVDAIYTALDGDGPLALLVTLEYIEARRELRCQTSRHRHFTVV